MKLRFLLSVALNLLLISHVEMCFSVNDYDKPKILDKANYLRTCLNSKDTGAYPVIIQKEAGTEINFECLHNVYKGIFVYKLKNKIGLVLCTFKPPNKDDASFGRVPDKFKPIVPLSIINSSYPENLKHPLKKEDLIEPINKSLSEIKTPANQVVPIFTESNLELQLLEDVWKFIK